MEEVCPECGLVDEHAPDCSRGVPAPPSFGRCDNSRCILQRHIVQAGHVWHRAANGRAWITGPPK